MALWELEAVTTMSELESQPSPIVGSPTASWPRHLDAAVTSDRPPRINRLSRQAQRLTAQRRSFFGIGRPTTATAFGDFLTRHGFYKTWLYPYEHVYTNMADLIN